MPDEPHGHPETHTPQSHRTVRRSYDEVAESYLEHFGDELAYKPLDRALLDVIVEELPPESTVADIGCGPGHAAAWLTRRGARAVGIDLSAAMIELGRRHFPQVDFRQGDLLALPAQDEEFDAVVALYSIIHLARHELEPSLVEMRRAMRRGAPGLVSFHVGTETRHLDEWWGRPVDLDFHFLEPEAVIAGVERAGLRLEAKLERRNYPQEVETTRAYLLVRRPGADSV